MNPLDINEKYAEMKASKPRVIEGSFIQLDFKDHKESCLKGS